MSNEVSKSQVISSLFWKLMERGGTQGIQFTVQIVLARLLMPEDYGIIALVMVFVTIANVFAQSGLTTALIQKKDTDEADFSSVFFLSLLLAALLYVVLFFTAPWLAIFFRITELTPVLRVLAVILFLGAFSSVQYAVIARNMQFKKLFFSSLGAIIASGSAGIYAAYAGWGVWALVVQQLTNQSATIVILFFTVRWRPVLVFSVEKVKRLFSFGSKLLLASLLDTLYRDIRNLVIGRIYNPAMLGFYNRGQNFPNLIVSNIDGSIQAVMLPALSSHQDNRLKVKGMVRRSILTSSFLIFPMMVGLAVVAEPLVKIILTEKWLPAVPFLQIFCASYALMPIHTSNLQAIKALGRSDIFLKLEVIKKIFGLAILAISIPFGIYAIAWSALLSSVISTIINAYPNLKLLDYSYKAQWKDIMPALLISLLMGAVIYSLIFLNISLWLLLLLQIILGAVLYFGLARVFKIESLLYLTLTLKDILKSRKEASA